MILTEAKYNEIERDWNRLPKENTKKELMDKVQQYSRVTYSFDEQIGKNSLVATLMTKYHGEANLTAYYEMHQARTKLRKQEKRKARRAYKKEKLLLKRE